MHVNKRAKLVVSNLLTVGRGGDPFYIFINVPKSPDQPSTITNDDFLDGYLTTIRYLVRDICGQSMIGFDATEFFESDKISDYAGENWEFWAARRQLSER